MTRARRRIAECFVRAALGEMDTVARSIGYAGASLPSNTVADTLRAKAAVVVGRMGDKTIRELDKATDEVLTIVFADIARKTTREVLS